MQPLENKRGKIAPQYWQLRMLGVLRLLMDAFGPLEGNIQSLEYRLSIPGKREREWEAEFRKVSFSAVVVQKKK